MPPRAPARPYVANPRSPEPGVADGAKPGSRLARFGALLRARRVAASLTQADLAERAQLDVSYISQLERGLRDPSLSSMESLAGALGLSMSQFFDEAMGDEASAQTRVIAQELSSLDDDDFRDAVEILRRFRAAVERAKPPRAR
jgi:transcriptional regulator with XRE-family HTH domain